MKTTFNTVLQAAVAATVLTFAGASHAADVYSHSSVTLPDAIVNASTSGFFKDINIGNNEMLVSVAVYEMTSATNGKESYTAYCIEPAVNFRSSATYTATYDYSPSDAVRKLYESSYASTIGNTTNQFAFQLALWELQKDDGNLSTGTQFFSNTAGVRFTTAANMLSTASAYQLGTEQYKYVSFEGMSGTRASQQLLGVSAVPEADTWAMMAVGLGLLGMVGRRKQKNEKFA